jgi:hypothetical protein
MYQTMKKRQIKSIYLVINKCQTNFTNLKWIYQYKTIFLSFKNSLFSAFLCTTYVLSLTVKKVVVTILTHFKRLTTI